MKKNLLLAALVIPLLSVSAQWTQTGGTVTVQPNTLHYMSGSYEVNGGGQAINKGNVNVQGDFTIDENTPNTEFRNKFTSGTEYGQLIINQNSPASGKIVGEYGETSHTQFYNQPIAFPYTDLTAEEVASLTGITNGEWSTHTANSGWNSSRYKNPVFTWWNEQHVLHHNAQADVLLPTANHNVNQGYYNLEPRLTDYTGTPANGTHTISGEKFNVENNFDVNIYGEWAYTYLDDFTMAMPNGWNIYTPGQPVNANGYASNLYHFGNPYTSNIDLSQILPLNGDVTHVYQVGGNEFDNIDHIGSSQNAPIQISTLVGGAWSADSNALNVRPYHTYRLKTKSDLNNFSFNLNDNIKTFNINANAMSYPSLTNRNSNDNQLYQVRVNINNSEGKQISRLYIIAHNDFQPAAQQGNEAYNLKIEESHDAIYTLQETAEGTIAEHLRHNKTYINGINATDYIGKPITIVNQVANAGDYNFTFDLTEDLINSGNKFYFEDSETGFFTEITEDFSYEFSMAETQERFNIYWNAMPETLNVSDITAVSKTLVYKDSGETFKVRFAENWNRADIYVYNVMGQLVHSAKSLDASMDYTLPLKGHTSAYIVKAVNENGEVATQKIIKK